MPFVTNDQFITQLTNLYKLAKTKKTGSVWVSFKKSTVTKEIIGIPPGGCMVRATNGRKKIATIVKAKEVGKFNQNLVKVMNSNFGLVKI
ncbi:Signal recognition particle 14 kDa protein [Entamoeba marina]